MKTAMTPNQRHYDEELRTMLGNPVTRVFLWRLIVEDCHVFDEDVPLNASAYPLLAKQAIGKRLLADMKAISPELTFQAEIEYNELRKQPTPRFSQEGDTDNGRE